MFTGDIAQQFKQHGAEHSSVDVSVVVPVHNGEKDIEQCLGRIRDSVGCSFEIVVVNDASTDQTKDIAEGMATRVITLKQQSGPAVARNRAVGECRGEIVVFVDCDVMISNETLQNLRDQLEENKWAAVFGSYDRYPKARNLVSVYKNLMHHHYHQGSDRKSHTFWSGCGAIRKVVFEEMWGFNQAFAQPSIEDIELGMRISEAGYFIGSVPEIQVQHTKRWTLRNLVYTDVFLRGIPWTRLMLQAGAMQNDLNVSRSQRACVLIAGLIVVVFAVLVYFQPVISILPVLVVVLLLLTDLITTRPSIRQIALWTGATLFLALVAFCLVLQPLSALMFFGVSLIGLLSQRSLRFLMKAGGLPFMVLCVPLHLTYFLYCGFSFAAGTLLHLFGFPFYKPLVNEQEAGCVKQS